MEQPQIAVGQVWAFPKHLGCPQWRITAIRASAVDWVALADGSHATTCNPPHLARAAAYLVSSDKDGALVPLPIQPRRDHDYEVEIARLQRLELIDRGSIRVIAPMWPHA